MFNPQLTVQFGRRMPQGTHMRPSPKPKGWLTRQFLTALSKACCIPSSLSRNSAIEPLAVSKNSEYYAPIGHPSSTEGRSG